MPLSFAYGSNMDRAGMAGRCPGSRPLGPARLPGHRLVVMREGYASVLRDPRHDVHGLLWDIALADMPALDRYEEVAAGLYAKRVLSVLTPAGPRRALVYLGRNAGPGIPRPGYLEEVLAAAAAAGLPAAYRAEIARLGRAAVRDPSAMSGLRDPCPPRPIAAVRPTRSTPFDGHVAGRSTGWRWEP